MRRVEAMFAKRLTRAGGKILETVLCSFRREALNFSFKIFVSGLRHRPASCHRLNCRNHEYAVQYATVS